MRIWVIPASVLTTVLMGCVDNVPLQGFIALPKIEQCSISAFSKEKRHLCTSKDCRPAWIPKEIADISRGIYTEYLGYSVNEGLGAWKGIDFERAHSVSVLRFAGPRLENAYLPHMNAEASFSRETKSGSKNWIDVIHIKPMNRAILDKLSCSANPLWTSRERLATQMITDSENSLYLIDDGAVKRFGGLGGLTGAARDYADLIDTLIQKNALNSEPTPSRHY